jgi:fructosamine-3-kinase
LPDYGLIVPEAEAAAVCQIGRGTHNSWYGYLKLHLVAHIDCCRRIGAISTTESTEIERRLSDGFARLDDVPARLLHGDLGGHNIFARGAEVAAIIDWEDCLSGDPVYDVAFWGTFHRDEHLIPFLEGYLNGAPAGGDFMQRYWLYYLRISLAKTVHRHRFGYTDPPGRAPASARIQKALDRLRALSPVML